MLANMRSEPELWPHYLLHYVKLRNFKRSYVPIFCTRQIWTDEETGLRVISFTPEVFTGKYYICAPPGFNCSLVGCVTDFWTDIYEWTFWLFLTLHLTCIYKPICKQTMVLWYDVAHWATVSLPFSFSGVRAPF